ncbi:MAG TPA: rhodanese-like domain-containing protein [Rhodoblastus sp.]|nr:rhodanese-like domain-containing protein [Rhodoblastus sp.]
MTDIRSMRLPLAAGAALAGALWCSAPALAQTLPGPLVSAQWLADNLDKVQVIDVGEDKDRLAAQPKFVVDKKTGAKKLVEAGGHIANARFVDFAAIREERTVDGVKLKAMMPTRDSFEKTMDAAGVDTGKPIVIVSTADSVSSLDMATRLYFQLKYFGDDKIAVMNGGLNAWLAAGLPVTTDPIAARQGDWKATAERADILATTDDVKAAMKDGSAQLVDGRPVAQYFGIAKSPVVKAGGHLEGARMLPTEAIATSVGPSHQFMGEKQYTAIYKSQDIDASKPSIAYCNTGHFASGAWFVASEIMGQKNAKMYAGSMNEWTNLGNPVVGLPQ